MLNICYYIKCFLVLVIGLLFKMYKVYGVCVGLYDLVNKEFISEERLFGKC